MLKKLLLKQFKLFKKEEFTFNKINIIKGINLDDIESSSNGSGKSSILEAMIFVLYGEGSGKNLIDLISFDNKETITELEEDNIKIIRKIPTELKIFKNNQELQLNTNTLKQNALNDMMGSYDFFKKYRLINRQAINLLDLGIISLRKELMSFINLDFTQIRQNLLSKKLERETYNTNKRLYRFYLSNKRLDKLENGLKKLEQENINEDISKNEQQKIVNNIISERDAIKREIYYKQNEIKQAKEGICPVLKTKCEKITKSLSSNEDEKNLEIFKEIEQLSSKLEHLKEELEVEQDYLNNLELGHKNRMNKIQKTASCLMKLKEAFHSGEKFKYTQKDIELYNYSIKVLDEFSGWYIQNWLDNLTIIINDLLYRINLSVKFSADKQFLTIINENKSMKYESLSSGQQCFLNCIFKIAILLNNGITDGLLLFDEGINVLDKINLKKLIDVLKTLNFQTFLIYQNYDLEDTDINLIEIERKNNQSYKK